MSRTKRNWNGEPRKQKSRRKSKRAARKLKREAKYDKGFKK